VAALDAVKQAVVGAVGEIVTVYIPNRGRLTKVYAIDPERSIIELQSYD
jgi:hypothetical protein